MEIKGDHLVLLHSEIQNTFVVDRLSEVVKRNMDLFVSGVSVDYVVVGIAETAEELQAVKQRLLDIRQKYREKSSDLPDPYRIS